MVEATIKPLADMISIVVVSNIGTPERASPSGARTARLSLVVLFQFAPMLMGSQYHKLNQFKKIRSLRSILQRLALFFCGTKRGWRN